MNNSIFVHIGTHKTGTSSIQKTLIESTDALKKEGVKYINLYKFERAQEIMTITFDNKALVQELTTFINSHLNVNFSKYIICCEYLSGNPRSLYANVSFIAKLLHDALIQFEHKHIFVALRKQDQFIQSIYTQYVHQAEDVAMDTLLEINSLDHIKWTNFLKPYQDIFGSENLCCVPYDKTVLATKNMLNYFGDFAKIKVLRQLDLTTSNHGYNKDAMKIAKESNPNLNATEQKILRLRMQDHLGKEVFGKYELLDSATVAQLDAHFQEDNRILFQTYFNDFGIDTYTEIEASQKHQANSQNNYIKLIVALIKEISTLKLSNAQLLKSNSKGVYVSPKQLLKNQIKKVVKRKPKGFPENSNLRNRFGHYKKAVILGSASSINKLDITQYSEDFVITVGNFYEHPEIEKINPKVHIFAASHPPITEEVLKEWWSRCHEILPMGTPLLIEKRDKAIAQSVFQGRDLFFYSYGGTVPVDFTKPIMSPWSVTIVALQLAIYCNIETIGILGVNHDWQCIKPYTHFYDHTKPSLEYYLHKAGIEISYEKQKQPFPKERLYREYGLYQQYETLKEEATKHNLKIFNFDPFSDFDVFEFDKQTNIIKESV